VDRSRRRPGRLIALLAVVLLGAAAAAPPAPPLRAMRWLAPGVDASVALTRRPTECLSPAADAAEAYAVALGLAAFRTPLVLGGQAARAGLSCDSCHQAGRDNPDFDFPGVSGAPGTADVTTSVLSSHEMNAAHGAVRIPNLSGPKSALKTSQDPASGALEAQINAIATHEFDGEPMPASVLKGLAAYVRRLTPEACPAEMWARLDVRGAMAEVRTAAKTGSMALLHGDGPAAVVMLASARSQLGDIDERYAGPELAPQRAALAQSSLDLAAAQAAARRGDLKGADADITLWFTHEPALTAMLAKAEPRSLYNRATLAEAVKRAAHPPAP
jgi:hypothetical protein